MLRRTLAPSCWQGTSNMAANSTRVSSPIEGVVNACKEPYSEHAEDIAVEAVVTLLDYVHSLPQGFWATPFNESAARVGGTMLMVASENGYPEVVRKLLEDENFVKFELDARAKETRRNPGGFTSARKLAKHAKQGHLYSSAGIRRSMQESDTAWEGVKGRRARCRSCYDMITLYFYIGEEIDDVPTLRRVIAALRHFGWETMDDIQDRWSDVRDELRKGDDHPSCSGRICKIESALVTRLSEVLVNYRDNWAKPFNELEESKSVHKHKSQGVFSGASLFWLFSPIVFLPVIILAINDVVHWEEQLWSKCFAWLCGFALAQIIAAFLTAPYLSWGMIKESSQDKDLGLTLKGSMSTQAIVSTLVFSMTMSKLQISPSLDMVVDFNQTASTSEQYAGFALAQWYASHCALY